MEFRPCIDIHNGKVKQIVGGSLLDEGDKASENFVSDVDAAYYAKLYEGLGLKGGHVILLNAVNSPYYEETKKQAYLALQTYPQGLQVGGGITADNAKDFLDAGASHVIVTSYVFHDGRIDFERLQNLVDKVGREHLVLDLSCKREGDSYYIVTDRWQKMTEEVLCKELMEKLSAYCDEFLVHAVDVEGKAQGIEAIVAENIGKWSLRPVTYAGGVHSYEDLKELKRLGDGKVNITIGSALSLFGGSMDLEKVLEVIKE